MLYQLVQMILKNHSLLHFNSFGIDVNAMYYACLNEFGQIHKQMASIISTGDVFLILGAGSNLLFTSNYKGVIVHNCLKGIDTVSEDSRNVYIRASAGENWDEFVALMVEKGYGGLENLSLIPGSTGSSPVQNIGAYGVEVKDRIVEVEGYSIPDLKFQILKNEECRFNYRDSIFKNELKGRFLITAVVFKLDKHPVFNLKYGAVETLFRNKEVQDLKSLRETIIEIRRSKLPDPSEYGNAGSFFKNPVVSVQTFNNLIKQFTNVPGYPSGIDSIKIPAAWLIEKAGWKGVRDGDVGTWSLQPLVIVNYGSATGREIFKFSEKIKQSVFEKFEIELVREVNVI